MVGHKVDNGPDNWISIDTSDCRIHAHSPKGSLDVVLDDGNKVMALSRGCLAAALDAEAGVDETEHMVGAGTNWILVEPSGRIRFNSSKRFVDVNLPGKLRVLAGTFYEAAMEIELRK